MGAGVAELLARNAVQVLGVEVDEESARRSREHIEHSVSRAVERGKLSAEDADGLLGRISISNSLSDLAGADLVIEAVPERLELKAEIFAELDGLCRPDAVLASNTSALSITEIAVHSGRAGRVVGMHFFNPPTVLQLVEVVRSVITETSVVKDLVQFAESLGKVPVVIGDRAGFIANALLMGYLNHAARMFEERYASREDLDAAMRYGAGYPIGPLGLLDLIGLDTAYEILDTMHRQSDDRRHAPAPIFQQMIKAGLLGRKSGRGFYTYDAPHSSTVRPDQLTPEKPAEAGAEVREVRRVGVVGTGTMASGIAEVFAKAGFDVTLRGRSEDKVGRAVGKIEKSLARAVDRGRLAAADRDATLERITRTTHLEDFAEVDLVVEAIAEDVEVKRATFGTLDEVCKPGAILATTTSSLPVVECAAATSRPTDVIGLHFFNPAPVMRLVEVVSTITTAPEVAATAVALCQRLKKVPVSCGDQAGFIVNALLFPYLNDAVKMLEAHYATADDIDAAMKTGCALPMGPFELLDVVGLDVSLAILKSLHAEFREPGFASARLLEHMVTAGRLGRKTNHGFRDHPGK
jgi:3-hydroxybutyryl-CoA dehydrogenase